MSAWQRRLDELKTLAKSMSWPLTPEHFRQNMAARRTFEDAVKSKAPYADAITAAAAQMPGYRAAETTVLGLSVKLSLHESSGTEDIPAGWRWHLSISGVAKPDDLKKVLARLGVPEGSKIGDLPMATHWGWAAAPVDVPGKEG